MNDNAAVMRWCRRLALVAVAGCGSAPPEIGAGFAEHGIDGVTAELDAACTARGVPACLEAAARYRDNPDAYAQRRRVVVLYRGCMMGLAAGCNELAQLVEAEPARMDPDRGRLGRAIAALCGTPYPARPGACLAAAFRARACDAGDAAACGALADAYAGGSLGRRDAARARRLRGLACARGDDASCIEVALQLVRGAHGVPPDPARAEALLRSACDDGRARACRWLGHLHRRGVGVALDATSARARYERACDLDDAEACHAQAIMIERGLGGDADAAGALALYTRACEGGHAPACVALGRRVEHGRGTKADPAGAYEIYRSGARLFEAACDGGEAAACGGLGQLLREGSGVAQDRSRGLALEQRACEAGDAPACLQWMTRGSHFTGGGPEGIGVPAMAGACLAGAGDACFVIGRIGARAVAAAGLARPRDAFARGCALGHAPSCNAAGVATFPPDAEGRAALERACTMGDAAGCHHLGLALEQPGAAQSVGDAAVAYRAACRWGLARACTRLADLRASGATAGADPGAAHSLYERACELGDRAGCQALGAMLLAGTRVARDAKRGASLLARACDRGVAAACGTLGLAMVRGDGVPLDPDEGLALLSRGCQAGDARACATAAETRRRLARPAPGDDAALRSAVGTASAACLEALDVCHHGAQARATRAWSSDTAGDDGMTLLLGDVPACDAPLERRCNDASDAAIDLCTHAGEGCRATADLLRRMSAVGLAISHKTLGDIERRAADKQP